jgi:hypothetical protein
VGIEESSSIVARMAGNKSDAHGVALPYIFSYASGRNFSPYRSCTPFVFPQSRLFENILKVFESCHASESIHSLGVNRN